MPHPPNALLFRRLTGLSMVPFWLLLIWLIFLTPLALPNMGGSGLKLPQNIITWAVMAAVISCIWLTLPASKIAHLTATARWLLLAVVILGIPVLYTQHHWRDAALARWLGLLGGWVFYVSLLQYRIPHFGRLGLFYGILAAATFQALLALLQFTVPSAIPAWLAYPMLNGRPYGVFQQVNVLASFMTTGLALALMLFLLPGFTLTHRTSERCRQCILGLALVLLSVVLVWLQSRIGWLTGGLVGILLLLLGWGQAKKQTSIALGLMVFGIVNAIFFQMAGSIDPVEHAASNQARLIMLHDTLKMIAEKPWLGWGYGGFEYSFQHYRLGAGLSTLGLGVVRHPHNELLLWWAEGGIVALTGMAVILFAGARLVQQTWRKNRQWQPLGKQRAGESLALAVALLPLLLHSQTEYPFTLAATGWAIFLLLLAQWDRQISTAAERTPLSPATTRFWRGTLSAISATAFMLASIGLYANLSITAFERNQLLDIEPARRAMNIDLWVNTERWQYDKYAHSLLVFNQTRAPQLLDNYAHWAQSYLSRRIDKNVYAAWLAIAQYQQDATTHHYLRQEAQALFPDDPRFLTDFIYPQQEAAL